MGKECNMTNKKLRACTTLMGKLEVNRPLGRTIVWSSVDWIDLALDGIG
jgi:hypothetical protein